MERVSQMIEGAFIASTTDTVRGGPVTKGPLAEGVP